MYSSRKSWTWWCLSTIIHDAARMLGTTYLYGIFLYGHKGGEEIRISRDKRPDFNGILAILNGFDEAGVWRRGPRQEGVKTTELSGF